MRKDERVTYDEFSDFRDKMNRLGYRIATVERDYSQGTVHCTVERAA